MIRTVQFDRRDLSQARLVEAAPPTLAKNTVRLRIESFSVTANNVTYAVVGDAFGYWNFFPGEGEWGVLPMWGHAVVEASNNADLVVGERVYGYLPMASHLDIRPVNATPGGFIDAAEHRQPMSPIYNQYSRLSADPEHDPARENERMIFGPLFKTGFLIESMMRREQWFGAKAVVVSSASSKTALAFASVTKRRSPGVARIGLTSAGNAAFVRASGLYDAVLPYDAISDLPQVASVSVDFAGNAGVLHAVHSTLGDNLKYSCTVGATHVGAGFGRDNGPIPGVQPVLFFAPDHAVAAIKDQGAKAFGEAIADSWRHFLRDTAEAVAVDELRGLEAARDAFASIYAGKADPSRGIVVRP